MLWAQGLQMLPHRRTIWTDGELVCINQHPPHMGILYDPMSHNIIDGLDSNAFAMHVHVEISHKLRTCGDCQLDSRIRTSVVNQQELVTALSERMPHGCLNDVLFSEAATNCYQSEACYR